MLWKQEIWNATDIHCATGETWQCMVGLQGAQLWHHAPSSLGPFCNRFAFNDQTVICKHTAATVMVNEKVQHVKPEDIRYLHLLSKMWKEILMSWSFVEGFCLGGSLSLLVGWPEFFAAILKRISSIFCLVYWCEATIWDSANRAQRPENWQKVPKPY